MAFIKPEKKIFVDPTFAPILSEYIFLIGFMPLFLLFSTHIAVSAYKILKVSGLSDLSYRLIIGILLAIISLMLLLLFIVISISKAKYGIYRKIETDKDGISFFGLLKKFQIRWDEIVSLKIHGGIRLHIFRVTLYKIKLVGVKVGNGEFYFPLSMKAKGQEYPAYYFRLGLVDQNENKIIEIDPEACPLYVEIQKYLGNK